MNIHRLETRVNVVHRTYVRPSTLLSIGVIKVAGVIYDTALDAQIESKKRDFTQIRCRHRGAPISNSISTSISISISISSIDFNFELSFRRFDFELRISNIEYRFRVSISKSTSFVSSVFLSHGQY